MTTISKSDVLVSKKTDPEATLPSGKLSSVSVYRQRPGTQPPSAVVTGGIHRIELVTGGRGWVKDEDDWIEVQAGHLLWHQDGDTTIGRSDPENPYVCLNALFEVQKSATRPVNRVGIWRDVDVIQTFIDDIMRKWVDEHFPRKVLSQYVWSTLLYRAVEGQLHVRRQRFPKAILQAHAYMEENLGQRITVAQLASAVGSSESYLHELFREWTGSGPHQYLIEARLRTGCRKLATTDQPIKQIALETGFTHASAFCHAFKKHYGLTPASYRSRALQLDNR
jgi:AraC-like DNA-binding protein